MPAVVMLFHYYRAVAVGWPRYARRGAEAQKGRDGDIKQLLPHTRNGFIYMTDGRL